MVFSIYHAEHAAMPCKHLAYAPRAKSEMSEYGSTGRGGYSVRLVDREDLSRAGRGQQFRQQRIVLYYLQPTIQQKQGGSKGGRMSCCSVRRKTMTVCGVNQPAGESSRLGQR